MGVLGLLVQVVLDLLFLGIVVGFYELIKTTWQR